MKAVYDFWLPGVTPMYGQYLRWHWTKQRKHTRDMAEMLLLALDPPDIPPLEKCELEITRRAKPNITGAKKRIDWDGLLGGMKGLLDALTATHKHGVGLIADDSIDCIVKTPTIIPAECEGDEPERMFIRIFEVV